MAADLRLPGRRRASSGWAAGCWPPAWRWRWWWRSSRRALVSALYVRPNEISLERPYIQTHIHATRSAFGLEQQRAAKSSSRPSPNAPIDVGAAQGHCSTTCGCGTGAPSTTPSRRSRRCAPTTSSTTPTWTATPSTASTARCCWRRASSTSASCPTRAPTGSTRPSSTRTATALVLAEVSQITPDGLPVLLIENAPPEIKTPSLKLTRPEIYYGEVTHEPVFVHTAQEEFNYPSGENNVHSRYEGKGGFPDLLVRHAPGRRHQRRRAQHPADRLPHRQQPHDDPPQGARPPAGAGRLPRMGHRSLPGDHRRRPAGVDGGRLHHFRRASLFARGGRAATWAA